MENNKKIIAKNQWDSMENNKKIIAKNQWDEKWLREGIWMPFGSICNIIAQSYQGKGISTKELEKLTKLAFDLSVSFILDIFERIEKEDQNNNNPELPTKQ